MPIKQLDRSVNRACFIVLLWAFFKRLNLLNDLSADATVAGRQQKTRNAMETLIKIYLRLRWINLLNKAKGSNFLDPKFQLWILFSCSTFWGNFFSETSVEYIFAKFVDLLTMSSSLISVYSHNELNALFVCLATLNRALSPVITRMDIENVPPKLFLRVQVIF